MKRCLCDCSFDWSNGLLAFSETETCALNIIDTFFITNLLLIYDILSYLLYASKQEAWGGGTGLAQRGLTQRGTVIYTHLHTYGQFRDAN